MKVIHCLSLGCVFALIACSGSNSSAIYHPDVGPFDENGDYVVAMADEPVTKHLYARSRRNTATKATPVSAPVPQAVQPPVRQIAKVNPRPAASLPQPPVLVAAPRPIQPTSAPVLIARSPQRGAVPVLAQAPPPVVIAPTPPPAVTPVAPVAVPQPVVAPQPTPAPQPVVKPVKKTPIRHTVKGSDTLFGLSRKYGVSVGSIQRANGIKGTTIVTGRTLTIPK